MAEYRQDWEFEIKDIFLSENLEEIVDGTRSFFRRMNPDTGYEREKIQRWLAYAYQHEEVSRTPFFPILFLYAVCENENFSEEKITRYMKYAVQYIYNAEGELEYELRNGWLKNHLNELPGEHRKVARVYQDVVDCLYTEEEADTEGAMRYQKNDNRRNLSQENNWGDSRGKENFREQNESIREKNQWDNENYIEEDEDGEDREQKKRGGKKSSSKKGLVIGLIAGILIGITLGCTGTALILNKYHNMENQQDTSRQQNTLESTPSQDPSASIESTPSETTSSEKPSSDLNSSDAAPSASDPSESAPSNSNSLESTSPDFSSAESSAPEETPASSGGSSDISSGESSQAESSGEE